jgi:hypothetical protein
MNIIQSSKNAAIEELKKAWKDLRNNYKGYGQVHTHCEGTSRVSVDNAKKIFAKLDENFSYTPDDRGFIASFSATRDAYKKLESFDLASLGVTKQNKAPDSIISPSKNPTNLNAKNDKSQLTEEQTKLIKGLKPIVLYNDISNGVKILLGHDFNIKEVLEYQKTFSSWNISERAKHGPAGKKVNAITNKRETIYSLYANSAKALDELTQAGKLPEQEKQNIR